MSLTSPVKILAQSIFALYTLQACLIPSFESNDKTALVKSTISMTRNKIRLIFNDLNINDAYITLEICTIKFRCMLMPCQNYGIMSRFYLNIVKNKIKEKKFESPYLIK